MSNNDRYLNELMDIISSQVQEILSNKVADKAKKIQRDKINEVVYDSYEPTEYDRRKNKKGGLLWGVSSSTLKTQTHNESEVSIYNKAEANMKYNGTFKTLPFLIEYGHGYNGMMYDHPFSHNNNQLKFTEPRPFMEETYNEIVNKNIVQDGIKRGLKKLGYKVK